MGINRVEMLRIHCVEIEMVKCHQMASSWIMQIEIKHVCYQLNEKVKK